MAFVKSESRVLFVNFGGFCYDVGLMLDRLVVGIVGG
jgi:hypothetical protein